MHPMQLDQVFVVEILTDDYDAVAITADQELDRFDRLVTRRVIAEAHGDHHMPTHRAQFGIRPA